MPGTTDKRLRLATPYVTVPCLVAAEHDPPVSSARIGAITSDSSCGAYAKACSGTMTGVFVYLI
ncbi:hypothetical protein V8C35DRAFT_305174 [Trichoderma chlorosporum]